MSDQSASQPIPLPGSRLIRTKLFIPRLRSSLVTRQDLLQRLNNGLESKLILLKAPAGFGKTTLVSSWLQTISKRAGVAWLSLEANDSEPVRFWSYFIAALQTIERRLGDTALAMLKSPQLATSEAIVSEILHDLTNHPAEMVLVLDDYHTIKDASIHSGVIYLIEHAPPGFHLCLVSRIDPPFPLPLWRARGDLLELEVDDLRFDSDEIRAFFHLTAGYDLGVGDLGKLETITEGWVAGLQLAALSIDNPEEVSEFVHAFSGSHRYVFDYLAQEVLDRQTPEVRHFLLNTSILERFQASLCDEVLQETGSQAVLSSLEAANLFLVSLDPSRIWYRYHHLFGEFLLASLTREASAAQIAALHARASRWFEAHDLPGEAIPHAILAGQSENAAAIISRYSQEMFQSSELKTFLGWLELLPEEQVSANIELSISAAWAHLATGHPESAVDYLDNIERVLGVSADGSPESLEQPVEIRYMLGQVAIIRASLVFNQMDPHRALTMAELALRYTGANTEVIAFNIGVDNKVLGRYPEAISALLECIQLSKQSGNPHLLPMAISNLAEIHLTQGKLTQAERDYRDALQLVQQLGVPSPLAGSAYTGLGLLMIERNQLSQASQYLEKGMELGRRWSNWEALIAGISGLTKIRLINGDIPGAYDLFTVLRDEVQNLQVDWADAACQIQQVSIALSTRDIPALRAWLNKNGLDTDSEITIIQHPVALLQARIYRVLGLLDDAETLLKKIHVAAQQAECWGRVVESSVLLAVISQTGDQKQARQFLEQALILAEPEGYRRVFLDEGAEMANLLVKMLVVFKGQGSGSLYHYALSLLNDFADHRVSLSGGSEQPGGLGKLTDRELHVLTLIGAGKTNQEIADELVVSLSTVKTHVRNIFNKLEVNNRTQATSMARQLGLI